MREEPMKFNLILPTNGDRLAPFLGCVGASGELPPPAAAAPTAATTTISARKIGLSRAPFCQTETSQTKQANE